MACWHVRVDFPAGRCAGNEVCGNFLLALDNNQVLDLPSASGLGGWLGRKILSSLELVESSAQSESLSRGHSEDDQSYNKDGMYPQSHQWYLYPSPLLLTPLPHNPAQHQPPCPTRLGLHLNLPQAHLFQVRWMNIWSNLRQSRQKECAWNSPEGCQHRPQKRSRCAGASLVKTAPGR